MQRLKNDWVIQKTAKFIQLPSIICFTENCCLISQTVVALMFLIIKRLYVIRHTPQIKDIISLALEFNEYVLMWDFLTTLE
jgi:hypothetical protein